LFSRVSWSPAWKWIERMVSKVLVANRGEIARRIMRSCRTLGLDTVAIYSEADAGLPHVNEADEAVPVGAAAPRESYLNIENILRAITLTGADAVHPGYGFLSESARFAESVVDAGAVWIGPHPDTIRAMGDKEQARELARSAGVPVLSGSRRLTDGDTDALMAARQEVGFPLLVKASAGGGGIGMRRVDDPNALAATVEATRSMAAKAFGDGKVFLERYIPRARHIEVQVFGFGDGGGIHVHERECSLQRRYQKVIEETPAPGLAPSVRASMTQAAVAVVQATNYAGAGTVEFIVDADTQEYFFLEMNTRIQVEHPVTEMVTGLDLVGMQLDLARGVSTPLRQENVKAEGAAIECRLYAENPAKMFMPSPGTLSTFRLPEESADTRIETGYTEGNEVTPFYDPMLAKIIARGPTREAAIAQAVSALGAINVEGLQTNRDLLIACLEHPDFRAGNISTTFIEDNAKSLTQAEKAV